MRGVMHVTRAICGNQFSIGMNLWHDAMEMMEKLFLTYDANLLF